MRFSQLFCPTLKEDPKDAEIVSHKLMTRAGLIRKVAAGIYSFLPLGLRVLNKMENIVREEMNRVGGQEVFLPSMIPSDLWKETGRWEKYGPELLRIKDRHHNEFCYGPTHEEVISDIVRNYVKSYRHLPITLYQIQTKFRDEVRPRFGVMRSREFKMKDAYSFHASSEDLDRTYAAMEGAYAEIFRRAGLKFKQVKADSGMIGGSISAEFMVLAETGEDLIFACDACDYAANIEVAKAADGESCPSCKKGTLKGIRGIEVGHVFKLGQTYSEPMKVTFLDAGGKEQVVTMGCYGIGIARTVAAAIEQHHDEKGICWPMALAPYQVDVILTNTKDEELKSVAKLLYETLVQSGIEVIYDDRDESAGVKFKDAELIGFPIQIVVGKTWKTDQSFELKVRATGKTEIIRNADAFEKIQEIISGS